MNKLSIILIAFFLCIMLTFCTQGEYHTQKHKIVNLTSHTLTVFYHPDTLIYPQDTFESRSFTIAAFTDELIYAIYSENKYHIERKEFIDSIKSDEGKMCKKNITSDNSWEKVELSKGFFTSNNSELLFKLRTADFQ